MSPKKLSTHTLFDRLMVLISDLGQTTAARGDGENISRTWANAQIESGHENCSGQ